MASQTLSTMAVSPSTSQRPSHLLPWRINLNINNRLSTATSFVVGRRLLLRPSSLRNLAPKRRPSVATVLFSLPTAKPDKASGDKGPKWSSRAIRSFGMAELEARKIKYPNTGTEALLMGILVVGTSIAAKFLRANGITLFKVRDEIINLLGKSDLYYFSPEYPPLTEPAQKALDWAVEEKLKSGENGEVTATHLLLGIWAQKDSAGHKILASLGFDDGKAKELEKSMDKDYVISYK